MTAAHPARHGTAWLETLSFGAAHKMCAVQCGGTLPGQKACVWGQGVDSRGGGEQAGGRQKGSPVLVSVSLLGVDRPCSPEVDPAGGHAHTPHRGAVAQQALVIRVGDLVVVVPAPAANTSNIAEVVK